MALWNSSDLLSAIIETGGSRPREAAFFAGIALVVSQPGIKKSGTGYLEALSPHLLSLTERVRFIEVRHEE